MPDLPRSRFAANPLIILATAISIGVFIGHYFALRSRSVVLVVFVVSAILTITVTRFARSRIATSLILVFAFVGAGVGLSLSNDRASGNGVAGMFEKGIINPGDPVELTGVLSGEPELAPESFYLTLNAESIKANK